MYPWLIIGGGACVFWTIALGLGVPSLARVLGAPGPVRWAAPAQTRCVATADVDGKPYEFGDCINVRFMLDAPEFARPPHTVPHDPEATDVPALKHKQWTFTQDGFNVSSPAGAVEETPSSETQVADQGPNQEAPDPIGRTAY